jgi:hypothetical protein
MLAFSDSLRTLYIVMRFGWGAQVVAVAAIAALMAVVGVPAARADEAAALYDPGTVWVIHLTMPRASEEKLEADPEGEYQPGEFSIAASAGTPGSEGPFSAPVKAEIRLKGSASFESLSGKAAFKLKFKKGERPFGLKKLTLNNMVEDPSMTHETLAYEVARAAGVPAPRTGFAEVYLNGRDYGMHLDLETLDDQALERMFGTPFDAEHQHLYEGEDSNDVLPGYEHAFEVDEGDEANIADLEALIAAVNGDGAEPWSTRVAPFAELTEMTRMWAMEKYVGQWDGYSGQVGPAQPNNYYLYDNPQGIFQMLPWGLDESFMAEHHLAFDGRAGVLFDKCIEDAACAVRYWHSLSSVLASARSLGLPSRAAALNSMLTPWQMQEQGDGRFHYSRSDAQAAATETGEFATVRPGEAEAWLTAHEPPEEPGSETGGEGGAEAGGEGGSGTGGETGGGGGTPGDGSSGSTMGGSTGSSSGGSTGSPSDRSTVIGGAVVPAPANPPARIAHLQGRGAALSTALTLTAPGTVSQLATFELDGRRRLACSLPATEHEAGPVVVRCPLRPAVLSRLHDGGLRLRVVTTVRTDAGDTSKLPRLVGLRRWPNRPSSS